jgi:hypothetical protein
LQSTKPDNLAVAKYQAMTGVVRKLDLFGYFSQLTIEGTDMGAIYQQFLVEPSVDCDDHLIMRIGDGQRN